MWIVCFVDIVQPRSFFVDVVYWTGSTFNYQTIRKIWEMCYMGMKEQSELEGGVY